MRLIRACKHFYALGAFSLSRKVPASMAAVARRAATAWQHALAEPNREAGPRSEGTQGRTTAGQAAVLLAEASSMA